MQNYSVRDLLNVDVTGDWDDLWQEIEEEVSDGFKELLPLRLHVSNIPFSYGEEHLIRLLEPYGPVESAEIISNHRGSKGFGFVTMKCQADADRAAKALHGSMINGRQIEVNLATPRKFTSRLSLSSSSRSASSPVSPMSPGGPGFVFPRMMPSPVRSNSLPSPLPLQLQSPHQLRLQTPYFVTTQSSTTPTTPGAVHTIQNIFIFPPK